MCFTLQRYKIESNSQQRTLSSYPHRHCVLPCKDTKLKAIHNSSRICSTFCSIVFYPAKIQNWKQFTTINLNISYVLYCVLPCKDTKLKAIHNDYKYFDNGFAIVFYPAKIQNWKQFTTLTPLCSNGLKLCFTLQRYKIESNSQPPLFYKLHQ